MAYGLPGCTDKKQNNANIGEAFPLPVLNQLKSINGTNTDFSNKTLLINFWATWCTPCRKEMPDLQKLSETLDQSQFAVIGISVDDDSNLVKEFLLQYQIRFTNFQDENLKVASQLLGIQAFPETFIVSPTGIIIVRITGEQLWDKNFFNDLIDSAYQADIKLAPDQVFG
jgi:thiol-disulfide isomerase/thioredoxin